MSLIIIRINLIIIIIIIIIIRQELMMTLTSTVDQARMLAVSSPHSGDWLHALPLSGCGLDWTIKPSTSPWASG